MNCKLEFVFEINRRNVEKIASHKHSCYEVVYYLKGSGKTTLKNDEFFFSTGSFAVIEPDCYHDEEHIESTDVLCVGFSSGSCGINLSTNLYKDNLKLDILKIMRQIQDELVQRKKYYDIKANLLVTQLFFEVARMNEQSSMETLDFSYIKNYIDEHCNQNIDFKSLARSLGYSYDHFRHLFKNKTGCSPVKYIIEKRIENAKRLLCVSNMTISEISEECGFSNCAQFSSMFKKYTSYSPSELRKNYKNT